MGGFGELGKLQRISQQEHVVGRSRCREGIGEA
jgi:hypothetical protein